MTREHGMSQLVRLSQEIQTEKLSRVILLIRSKAP